MPRPRHVYETYIKATPDRIWNALTDGELTSKYYFGTSFVGTAATGSDYRMEGAAGTVAITGTVVEANPFTKLVMTFTALWDPEAASEQPSLVTWEITPIDPTMSKLSVVHSDFGGLSKTWSLTRGGWEGIVSGLKTLLETGEAIGEIPALDGEVDPVDLTAQEHRERGIEIFNNTWTWIEMADRTPDDDESMIRSAYAAAYHWSFAAGRTVENDARSEWMLSRTHVLAGRGEQALFYARRSAAIVEANGLADFDLGYGLEAVARSLALLGRNEEAAKMKEAASLVPIDDDEDRKIFEADLAGGPWFGLEATA